MPTVTVWIASYFGFAGSEAGFHIAVLPCLFWTLMGSTGEEQEHPTQAFNLGLPLRRMELCFHRDQSLCVSGKIFLGAAV